MTEHPLGTVVRSSRSVARLGRRNGQRGGAAVEFAIVLPVFCAVVFGTIDYGWYFYQRFTLAAAVRDGIRSAVTLPTTGAGPYPIDYCKTIAEADLGSAIPKAAVTWTSAYVGLSPAQRLTLEGEYAFKPLVGFVPLPKNAMKYKMTMMLEIQP